MIYLAGPINACDDEEVTRWRESVKRAAGKAYCSDPADRDYRGMEHLNVEKLVEDDKKAIDKCDTVFAYCWKPSVGTSMEILYAWERGKRVVIVVPSTERVSPWLTYHADKVYHCSLDEALTEEYVSYANH